MATPKNTIVDPYAPTTWGQQPVYDLEVPSGQLCQVRQAGVQNLIAANVLDSADTLTSLVNEKHIKRVQGRKPNTPVRGDEIDSKSLMKDPDNLRKVFTLIDRIVCHMVVQPAVHPVVKVVTKEDGTTEEHVLTPDERDPELIYSDMVNLMDKMYIFQYSVGGGDDLESFRKQFGEGMGGLATQ